MTAKPEENRLQQQPITQTLEKNYMPYAMSVIVSRAIPEIDGFKPSHRKLLYTMYRMGLLGGSRTKSANVVGQTMKLNPHGDQAIYETLVRLTRGNSALLHPYIDSKGNFGRVYSRDMQYAAARYTEVRLDKICEELFSGLDKNSVDFIDNYDSTTKEPLLLPAAFPSLLVNSNQGIAVGMASNICSFNLTEVCQAAAAYIRDPGCDLLSIMPAPDFSTGAELIYNRAEMEQIYKTGRGSMRLRATWRFDKKNNMVEIVEIPYTTTVEAIIDDITGLVKQGKVREINDIRDETDLNGLKIALELKRSTDPDALMQKLFRFTSLQSTFPCNFNVLVNGTPRVLGVRALLGEWLAWRRACVRREISYDLEKKQDRLHLLQGLEKILLDIDKAVRIIRRTEKESEVVPNLMAGFGIDTVQAEFVAEIRLRQLNRQYILQRTADIQTLVDEIADLEDMLANRERVDDQICANLERIAAKYGQKRLTRLVHEKEIDTFEPDQLIEDYNLRLFLTEHGYIKKMALTSLRSAGELKTKEEDKIVQEIEGKNKADVLFFSDRGNVYKLKCYDIKDHKPSDLGEYTPNLLEMENDERIVFLHMTEDYLGHVLLGFANGKFARIPLNAYETKTNRRKLVKAYSTASPVVRIFFLEADDDFVAVSNIHKVLVFNSAKVPVKPTRTNQGVQVLLSKKGSTLASCRRLSESNIADDKYYRTRKIPAVGTYLKEETLQDRQLGLDSI
ncbi:MAG: DNA topoisomerase (ATP-hydrolyzing) subunit A [Eubacteriales bacterium]|nr:DNA topoisomerase (ATP-hydrolyzing) subunit A [Clostridiales bacterium]MDD2440835.1 DNA topoisomerase (ATP-hydrolyzing) subunit A [Eubacteriales bacterium]MDD4138635.1 DNA topoisomerase (ATP-hydrolyzing) subunit A [Eubacteriales bacterium]MDD4743531.1 DNA topoisomerase (ATP-hydrolyzing) subunit A [Eubacteriales bacterium]